MKREQTAKDMLNHVSRLRSRATELASTARKLGPKDKVSFEGLSYMESAIEFADKYIGNAKKAVDDATRK